MMFTGTEAECNALASKGCVFEDRGFQKVCTFKDRSDNLMQPNNTELISSCGAIIGFIGKKSMHASELCGPGTLFKEQSDDDPLATNQCEPE